MTAQLKKLIDEYEFDCDFNFIELLENVIEYIEKLEKDEKSLKEIIDIQRHNLSYYRKKLNKK